MTFYINESAGVLLEVASDGSEDSFITEGFELADDDQVTAFRASQAAVNAPTPEQLLEMAQVERDRLLSVAALRIAPLQYAVDLDTATDSERSNMTIWKQYSIAVNRVSEQPKYPKTIKWPTPPGE